MSVAVPASADHLTDGYHAVQQGWGASLECFVAIRNDNAVGTVAQLDYYIVQDGNTGNPISEGSITFPGGYYDERILTATSLNLAAGTRQWTLYFYAHTGGLFHMSSYIKPTIFKA